MKWNSLLIPLIITCFNGMAFADASLVTQIRSDLQSKPREAVDQLNQTLVFQLRDQKQYAAIEEFAIAGTIAMADDAGRIEQLQKHRVEALLAEGRSQEALHAAKALFNVCTMHFVVEALPLLTNSIAAAHPTDPKLIPKFKLQMLANAQENPAERERLRSKCDNNSVMMSLAADPEPYAKAIRDLANKSDYKSLVSLANLELLSGHVETASDLLDRAYKLAPATEINSATEGLARKLKAQDGGVGRANQFVDSIRPPE
jgi:DNA-binding transcriptional regulator YbjK